MNVVYLNKKFVPSNKAGIPVLDRGFLYGEGVFETMRSYNGSVFRLEKHISRLFRSLKALDIIPGVSKKDIEKKIYLLLKKNKLFGSAYIKVIVTRPGAEGLLTPRGKTRGFLVIYALKYKPLPENVYKKGISVSVSGPGSDAGHSLLKYKTLNYLSNILWRRKAVKNGFDDMILLNSDGILSEATSSNVFLVKDGKIYTPSLRCGILPGITREEVIRIAGKFLKTKIQQINVKKSFLYRADEMFLTNSLAEIVPVAKIGKYILKKGAPGPITTKLIGLYRNAVKK